MPTTPAPTLTPEPTPVPTPEPTPTPYLNDEAGATPNTPQKSKTGLIIGIIVAVVLIAAIAIAMIFILGGKKDDGNNNQQSQRSPHHMKEVKNGEVSIKYNEKEIKITKSYANTLKSFIDSELVVVANDEKDDFADFSLTSANLDTYLSRTLKQDETTSVDVSESEDQAIANMTAHIAFSNKEAEVKYSDLEVMEVYLEPLTYTMNGTEFKATDANYDDIKAVFGDAEEYDEENDVYIYKNIGDFEYDFFMSDKKVDFIVIQPQS